MERPPSFESKESSPITPESVLAEIRSRFKNSRELYNHVKTMVDNNFAMRFGEPKTPTEAADATLHRLARYRRRGTQIDGIPFNSMPDGTETDIENVKDAFNSGALLGLLSASIYHGEATFVSLSGEMLEDPAEM